MNSEITKTLQTIGLTQSEAKSYLAILEQGKTTVSAIARVTKMNRRNVYDVLNTLLDKGLTFSIIGEKETLYAGVEPEKLLEMIQSKENALNLVLPELQTMFSREHIQEKAVMYQGIEGFKQYMQDVLTVGEDVRSMAVKAGWKSSELGDFTEWFEQERIKRKIKSYNLFEYEMKPVIEEKKPTYLLYSENRFLPKEYSTNSAFDVFGDYVVTHTDVYIERFDPNVKIYVMINRNLADAFRTWFQFMWDQCEQIKS